MSKKLTQIGLSNVGDKVAEATNQLDFQEEDQNFFDEWNRKSDYAHDLVSNVDTFESKYAQQAAELGVPPVALGVVTECHYGDGTDVKQNVDNFLVTHQSMAETGKDEVIAGRMMDNAWLAHYLYSQSDEGQVFAGASSNMKDTLTKLAENGLFETSKLTEDQAYATKEFANSLQVPEFNDDWNLDLDKIPNSHDDGPRGGVAGSASTDPYRSDADGIRGVQAGVAESGATYSSYRAGEPSGMAVQGVGGQAGMAGPGMAGQSGLGGATGQAGFGGQPGAAYRDGISRKPLPGTGEKTLTEEQTEAEKTSVDIEEKHEERVKQAEDLLNNVGQFFKDVGKKMGLDFGD